MITIRLRKKSNPYPLCFICFGFGFLAYYWMVLLFNFFMCHLILKKINLCKLETICTTSSYFYKITMMYSHLHSQGCGQLYWLRVCLYMAGIRNVVFFIYLSTWEEKFKCYRWMYNEEEVYPLHWLSCSLPRETIFTVLPYLSWNILFICNHMCDYI